VPAWAHVPKGHARFCFCLFACAARVARARMYMCRVCEYRNCVHVHICNLMDTVRFVAKLQILVAPATCHYLWFFYIQSGVICGFTLLFYKTKRIS
jgi:hypothetical protein